MSVTITLENVLPLLKKAVDTRGEDYNYQDEFGSFCVYTSKGKPACLIGVMLDQLGVNLNALQQTCGIAVNARNLPEQGVVIEPSALDVLRVAQAKQDGGYTWGKAYERAVRQHATYKPQA